MLADSDDPRTSNVTVLENREKYMAACPAEFAPPNDVDVLVAH